MKDELTPLDKPKTEEPYIDAGFARQCELDLRNRYKLFDRYGTPTPSPYKSRISVGLWRGLGWLQILCIIPGIVAAVMFNALFGIIVIVTNILLAIPFFSLARHAETLNEHVELISRLQNRVEQLEARLYNRE